MDQGWIGGLGQGHIIYLYISVAPIYRFEQSYFLTQIPNEFETSNLICIIQVLSKTFTAC